MRSGAKKQTLMLTAVNGAVRALGLGMRVMLSRMLGAEIMGIMELAQSVHMVIIAPLTSGLPAAVSRLTAKADPANRQHPLWAGLSIARTASLLLIPLLLIASPTLARMTGDARVLPSLWFSAPCVLILGYSAVYNGYCYGTGASLLPAGSELVEQIARFLITFGMLCLLRPLTAAWTAAVPVLATLLAEVLGLIYVLHALKLPRRICGNAIRGCRSAVVELAFPVTLSRLIQTVLRSLTAVLIPLRLQSSGLTSAEATARLGMLNGMVMPILMLPGVFTSALSMVSLPRIAKAEEQPQELKRLLLLCACSCLPFAALCAVGIYLAAPFLAAQVYRLPELSALFRSCAMLTLLTAAGHLTGSVLSALGLQKSSLWISTAVSACTLGLTWLWAADPALRIHGVIRAMYIGNALTLLLSVFRLLRWRKRAFTGGDKSA